MNSEHLEAAAAGASAALVKASPGAMWGGGASALLLGWLDPTWFGVLTAAAIGFAGLVVNVWGKWREDKRSERAMQLRELEHDARMRNGGKGEPSVAGQL